jgi:hypothetical protein
MYPTAPRQVYDSQLIEKIATRIIGVAHLHGAVASKIVDGQRLLIPAVACVKLTEK